MNFVFKYVLEKIYYCKNNIDWFSYSILYVIV